MDKSMMPYLIIGGIVIAVVLWRKYGGKSAMATVAVALKPASDGSRLHEQYDAKTLFHQGLLALQREHTADTVLKAAEDMLKEVRGKYVVAPFGSPEGQK